MEAYLIWAEVAMNISPILAKVLVGISPVQGTVLEALCTQQWKGQQQQKEEPRAKHRGPAALHLTGHS